MRERKTYSLVGMFGELPVHPDKFKELTPEVKWTWNAVEGGNWCVSCGTLTPNKPNSHHKECRSYKDLKSYPVNEPSIGYCPKCGSEFLHLDSSRELQMSLISCLDCNWEMRGKVDEETLLKRFYKMCRSSK